MMGEWVLSEFLCDTRKGMDTHSEEDSGAQLETIKNIFGLIYKVTHIFIGKNEIFCIITSCAQLGLKHNVVVQD